MKLTKSSVYIDGYYMLFNFKNPLNEENLRKNSIYENIKVPINILYFLIFCAFLSEKSISKSIIETKNFSNDIESSYSVSIPTVIRLYQILREKKNTF